ncbi:hypothetical protein C8J57DRAFT_431982 [Mycena rebaudengoi]|nr:hypothetical protein C8J57DRAFT_431982 [Mycena rebaudengoi]
MLSSIHGSQITFDGGTFNDVAGNMNQTFTTIVFQQRPDAQLISDEDRGDPADDFPASERMNPAAIRTGTGRVRGCTNALYATSQQPREQHSPMGIELIVEDRKALPQFGPPGCRSSTRSHGETCSNCRPTAISPHFPYPAASDYLTGSGSRITSALLPIPRANPENPIAHGISNIVHGNMTQTNLTSYRETGIDILYRHVVSSALHDSGERFTEPACHPGTRREILNELSNWSHDIFPGATPLLWLHGSAGAGKSAIAQELAGRYHKDGRLGGSFFFKRGHAQRGTWHGLFATLAYQLAMFSPELRAAIQQVMEADKLLVGRALSVQFNKLFVSTLRQVASFHLRPVILIDGLDECEDHRIQAQILRLLIGAIREQPFPVRLLIVSRPEPHLRDILRNELDICKHLAVSADESAYKDIRTYLCHEFARIQQEFSTSGIILEDPWPSRHALDHLVGKSSGMFIYASTVIRFVDDEYFHPNDRLQSVLRLDPQSTAPLDDLYTEILSSASHHPMLLRVLHSALTPTTFSLDPEEIDLLLELSPGTARLCFRGLHSVLDIPLPQTRSLSSRRGLAVLHASLRDYFCDLGRSGAWFLSDPPLDLALAHRAVLLLASPFNEESLRKKELYCAILNAALDEFADHIHPNQIFDVLRTDHIRRFWFARFPNVHQWLQVT